MTFSLISLSLLFSVKREVSMNNMGTIVSKTFSNYFTNLSTSFSGKVL